MHSGLDQSRPTPAKAVALTAPQLAELVGKLERENVNLRRQVAWFQRQIFGQKSERRLSEPEGAQGTLGEAFAAIPDTPATEQEEPGRRL